MTLAEAFVFKTNNNVSPTDAGTVLAFSGISSIDEWNPKDKVQRCKFYDALLSYLSADNAGVTSESEGGYSKSYDKDGKGKWLYALALESGCQTLIDKYDPTPIVQNKSNMW